MNIMNDSKSLKKIVLKISIWIPVILMGRAIFGFSGQNGEQSGGLSSKIASIIVDRADKAGIIDIDEAGKQILIDKMQYPIRKCAHMTEYAIFAALTFIALYYDGIRKRMTYIWAVIIAFLFACTDEFHQLFVPGRSGQFTDVCIDTIGACIGMLIIFLIRKIIYCRNKKSMLS